MRSFTHSLRTLCCGLLFLLATFAAQAQITYVTQNGAGNQSGSSWGNAAPGTQLQTAINNTPGGSQMWVAAGTYKPASGTSFSMKEGVKIYGSFLGNEATLSQRNLSAVANKSILQGNGSSVIVNDNNGLTKAAVLDGFTITGGTGAPAVYGPSTLPSGGGMLLQGGSPTINNCIFTDNTAYVGGAMLIRGSSSVLTNCIFSNNNSGNSEGVIYAQSGGFGTTQPTFINCTFSANNTALTPNFATITCSNCIIWGNSIGIKLSIQGSVAISYSLVQGGYGGTGNISDDPLFVNAPNKDFHLKPNSPALNKGDNSTNAAATDLDGNSRKYGVIDMGAYEYQCAPTTISSQPQNTPACIGGTATFTVAATGPAFTYKWYKDGQLARSSSNAATLTITNVQPSDAGNYTVDVIGDCGTVTSAAATLTVNTPPSITTAPASANKCVGEAASFSVSATGTNLTYQWKKNSVDINGATNATYSIAAVSVSDGGNYSVVVSGTCGSPVTSASANLFVSTAPSITTQPVNITTCVGVPYTVSLSASGTDLNYEWQVSTDAGSSWSNISSINGPSATFSTVTADMNGRLFRIRVYNDCGSVTSDAITLTVNTPPVLTVPANITTVSGAGNCSASVNFAATSTGMPASSITYTIGETQISSPYTFSLGTATVTAVATNTCGTDTKTFTVTVEDKTPPSFTAPAARDIAMSIDCSITVPDLTTGLTGSDNCGTVTFSQNPVAGTVIASGHNQTQVVTITANDGHGNTTNHDVTLTAKDVTPPTITPPAFVVVPTDAGKCSRSNVALGVPSYSDRCSQVVLTNDAPAIFPKGITTVTWTVTDVAGNTGKAFQRVTVEDKESPVVGDLPAITAECSATVTPTNGTDNCDGAIVPATEDALTYTTQGTYTIHWTYSDGDGNSVVKEQTVTIKDMTKPVPDVATLPDVTGECSVAVTTKPMATDNCAGKVTATTNDPLSYNAQGNYTIHWTYDDGAGNTSTQTQNVIVKDITKPAPTVATLPGVNSECSVTITAKPTATDNCAGTITGTTTDPLSYTAQGSYTIHWTYNDGNGNSTMQTQTVTVKDATKPVADVASLPDITGECSVAITAKPTATDNCAGRITASTVDALTYSAQGTYTIHWTYDDGNGNSIAQEQKVIIEDVTKPVPNASTLPDVTGDCNASVTTRPTATDNCAGVITGTTTDPLQYSIPGSYVIHWTYNDGAGNSSTQDQKVTVNGISKPVVSIDGPTTFCAGGSVTLTAPDGFATYLWSNGATIRSITVTQSNAYSVIAGNGNGCNSASSDAIVVTVRQRSTPTSFSATACNSYTLPWGGVVTSSNDYVHTYTNVNGCDSVVTAHVTINSSPAAPVITANGPTTICGSGSVTLSAPTGFASYKWSNNATTQSIVVTQSGTFTVTVSNAGGCTSPASNAITVTIAPDMQQPVITCPAPVTLCYVAGDNYTIALLQATDNCSIASITYSITGATTRSGSGANASGTFKPGTSTITWTVKDASGNTSTCQSKVVVGEKFTVSIPDGWALGSGCVFNTVYKGYLPAEYILLIANTSDCKTAFTYKWSNGATTKAILVAPQTATTYTVTVKNAAGCTQTASKTINVVDVRCGTKMDKVSLCYKNKALCVEQREVAGYLLKGAYLGSCRTGTTTMVATTANLKVVEEPIALELTASPNPSTAEFRLQIKGNADEKVSLTITDALGRVIESRSVTIGTVQVGASYRPGIYIATVMQGASRSSVKLIRQ